VWWVAVATVALAAVVVAAVVVVLRPSSPSSADELSKLLVTPQDRTVSITKGLIGPAANASTAHGVRWVVGLVWTGHQGTYNGVLGLVQYQTTAQAQDALAQAGRAMAGTRSSIPGHSGAFYDAGRSIGMLGLTVQAGFGAGVKGTVLAEVFVTDEEPGFGPHLLAQQLDRLP
jgi:hypothetical protein